MKLFRWWKGKQAENMANSNMESPNNIKVLDRTTFALPSYQLADHLVVNRLGNTHHGIFSGESQVIYYNYYTGMVVEASLEDYSKGDAVKVVYSPMMYNSATVISRARSRIGKREYHMMQNVGEQFVRWARGGGSY